MSRKLAPLKIVQLWVVLFSHSKDALRFHFHLWLKICMQTLLSLFVILIPFFTFVSVTKNHLFNLKLNRWFYLFFVFTHFWIYHKTQLLVLFMRKSDMQFASYSSRGKFIAWGSFRG